MGIIYVSSKTNTSLEDVGGFVARDVIIVTIVGADWRTMRKLYFWHLNSTEYFVAYVRFVC